VGVSCVEYTPEARLDLMLPASSKEVRDNVRSVARTLPGAFVSSGVYRKLVNRTYPFTFDTLLEAGSKKETILLFKTKARVMSINLAAETFETYFHVQFKKLRSAGPEDWKTIVSNSNLKTDEFDQALHEHFGVAKFKPWTQLHPHAGKFTVSKVGEYMGLELSLVYYGTADDHFHLKTFPFDVQDFNVEFEIAMMSSCPHLLACGTRAHSMLQEWTFFQPMLIMMIPEWAPDSRYVCTKMIGARNPSQWLAFYVQVGALTTLFPLVVFIPASDVGDRLSFLTTLLVATAALQITLTSVLPEIPYTTLLDQYVYTSFGIVCLSLCTSASTSCISDAHQMRYELMTTGTLVLLWVAYNIFNMVHIKSIIVTNQIVCGDNRVQPEWAGRDFDLYASHTGLLESLDPRLARNIVLSHPEMLKDCRNKFSPEMQQLGHRRRSTSLMSHDGTISLF